MSYLWWSFAVLWYNSYNIKLFSLENLSSTGWHHIYMKSTRHHQHLDTQYVRPSPLPDQKSKFSSKKSISRFLYGWIAFVVYFRKQYDLSKFWWFLWFYTKYTDDTGIRENEFFENILRFSQNGFFIFFYETSNVRHFDSLNPRLSKAEVFFAWFLGEVTSPQPPS